MSRTVFTNFSNNIKFVGGILTPAPIKYSFELFVFGGCGLNVVLNAYDRMNCSYVETLI